MFRRQPVAVVVALATLLEALIALAVELDWLEPGLGGAATVTVTAAVVFVRQLVTPVAKVAKVLDQPVEAVDQLLRKVNP
jgi:hypothetical protein